MAKKMTLRSLILIALLCELPLILWALPSLLPPTARTPRVDIRDLLVDVKDFPSTWRVIRGPEPFPERSELDFGEENLVVEMQPRLQLANQEMHAFHCVFRFRNEASAIYGYFWMLRQGILFPSNREPGQIPAEWSYRSPIADNWRFTCALYDEVLVCAAMARYDEYISVFSTTMSPECMTPKSLEDILRSIDERMIRNLIQP